MDRLFQKDLTVKVLSVVLAVILWFTVSDEQPAGLLLGNGDGMFMRPPAERMVTVTPANVPPGLRVAGVLPQVTVELRVNGVFFGAVQAIVDLREAGVGTGEYPVQVQVPAGATLVGVRPTTVRLSVEPAGGIR